MEKEILSQIDDIERRITAACEKHNIAPIEPYLLKITPDAFICCLMAEKRINRGVESEQVTLFATEDSPRAFSLLQNAAVCCFYAKEMICEKPNQSIFLLSAAHFYYGRYCQFGESIHAGKFERQWNSQKALKNRHSSNRDEKIRVIEHYKANKSKYQSKDQAAESIKNELGVHRSFRTVRAWLNNQ